MNVAVYDRVSTDGQDPELQLSALRAHAANRGWVITGEFIDQGYSGAKEKRPALAAHESGLGRWAASGARLAVRSVCPVGQTLDQSLGGIPLPEP